MIKVNGVLTINLITALQRTELRANCSFRTIIKKNIHNVLIEMLVASRHLRKTLGASAVLDHCNECHRYHML